MYSMKYGIAFLLLFGLGSCEAKHGQKLIELKKENMSETRDTATFGAGCFWCVEAVFLELKGVLSVESGYSGGRIANPTYKEVCSGLTGHAEVVRIVFDSSTISYQELLEVFFTAHDPTTLNRQGADVGTQYRSVIYYHHQTQQELARFFIDKLNSEKAFPNPVVTELSPATIFYKAEDYHQNYYAENQNQGYCRLVIKPKLDKVRKVFAEKIK